MLWRNKVKFAVEDVQALVSEALPSLQESLKEPVYVVDDEPPALITESELRKRVVRLLSNAPSTLDTTSIALDLRVPKAAIDRIIGEAASQAKSFFDGVHIIPNQKIKAIGAKLLTNSEVKPLSEICHDEGITLRAATYAVKQMSPHLIIVGKKDFVVSQQLLDAHVEKMRGALEAAQEPVVLATIESDAVLLPLVKHQLELPAHQDTHTPAVFLERKQADIENQLESVGYVKATAVSDVVDPAKFAKRTNGTILGKKWIVSGQLVNDQLKKLSTALSDKGYVDLRDTTLYPDLSNYLLEEADTTLRKFRSPRYPAFFLVKPSFERDLLSRVNARVQSEAVKSAESLALEVTGASALADFSGKAELPTLSQVDELVGAEGEFPADLAIADHILPNVRKHYLESFSEALKPRFEAAMEKLEAKVRCYLNAITTIPEDTELYQTAWSEWQQYVSDSQFPVPANAQLAEQQFNTGGELMSETVEGLRARLGAKLKKLKNKPQDAPLILHLACIGYHSTHFCPQPGLLKLKGRSVPKLLKQFDYPQCFNELRLKLKEAPKALLEEVRSTVTLR